MANVADRIESWGHWRIVIRPRTFVEKRVTDFATLYPIAQKTAVSFSGGTFPWIDNSHPPEDGVDWVGQNVDWPPFLQSWRLCQSGQFVSLVALTEDWLHNSERFSGPGSPQPGTALGNANAMLVLTEIYEFAARLSLTPAGCEHMQINIKLSGLKDRVLKRGNLQWPLGHASIEEFPFPEVGIVREQLIAESRELAVRAVQELFQRFNYNPSLADLRTLQRELCR